MFFPVMFCLLCADCEAVPAMGLNGTDEKLSLPAKLLFGEVKTKPGPSVKNAIAAQIREIRASKDGESTLLTASADDPKAADADLMNAYLAVNPVDLNGDGLEELLVDILPESFCGREGHPVYLFVKTSSGYSQAIHAAARLVTINPGIEKNMPDITFVNLVKSTTIGSVQKGTNEVYEWENDDYTLRKNTGIQLNTLKWTEVHIVSTVYQKSLR